MHGVAVIVLVRKSNTSYASKSQFENIEKQLAEEKKARENLEKEVAELRVIKDKMMNTDKIKI